MFVLYLYFMICDCVCFSFGEYFCPYCSSLWIWSLMWVYLSLVFFHPVPGLCGSSSLLCTWCFIQVSFVLASLSLMYYYVCEMPHYDCSSIPEVRMWLLEWWLCSHHGYTREAILYKVAQRAALQRMTSLFWATLQRMASLFLSNFAKAGLSCMCMLALAVVGSWFAFPAKSVIVQRTYQNRYPHSYSQGMKKTRKKTTAHIHAFDFHNSLIVKTVLRYVTEMSCSNAN